MDVNPDPVKLRVKKEQQRFLSVFMALCTFVTYEFLFPQELEWKQIGLLYTLPLLVCLQLFIKEVKAPQLSFVDGVLKVGGATVSVSDIDFDRSIISSKRLLLYNKKASWKNSLRADLSLLDDEEVKKVLLELMGNDVG